MRILYGWLMALVERFMVDDPELRHIKRKARRLRRVGHSIGLRTDEEIISVCCALDLERRGTL